MKTKNKSISWIFNSLNLTNKKIKKRYPSLLLEFILRRELAYKAKDIWSNMTTFLSLLVIGVLFGVLHTNFL